jgi:hypothetical protein
MLFQSLFGATLALAATANPIFTEEQQPVLNDGFEGQQVDLIKEFVTSSHPNAQSFPTKENNHLTQFPQTRESEHHPHHPRSFR